MKIQLVLALAGFVLLAYADRRTRRRSGRNSSTEPIAFSVTASSATAPASTCPVFRSEPRDHTDAKGMGDTPDDELFKAIKEGGLAVNKSVLMPTWGGVLIDAQITRAGQVSQGSLPLR